MTIRQLQDKYVEAFGEQSRVRNKQWLIKRIAWRLQATAEGDLSERARHRAAQLANDADLRLQPPKTPHTPPVANVGDGANRPSHPTDSRLPMPGTRLTRLYKGQTIEVTVLEDGFEYAGGHYHSLSAVAKAVTGSHWNGFNFFGLADKGRAK